MTIGSRLRMARTLSGLTQKAVAAHCEMPPMLIRRFEQDKVTPSSTQLLKLASV